MGHEEHSEFQESGKTKYKEKANSSATYYQRRRPMAPATEQQTRPIPPSAQSGMGGYGYPVAQNGMGDWPQPPMQATNALMMPGGLPTISWLCSCDLCVNSVQEFIAALNNSNGMYSACIATSGPVYNELVASGMLLPAAAPFVPPNGEANATGENKDNNGGAGKSAGSSEKPTAEKDDKAGKPATNTNGFSPDARPFYPMAPNGYVAQLFNGMQAEAPMFYNNNYWAPNMNATNFGNAPNADIYSAKQSTSEGDANENDENDEAKKGQTQAEPAGDSIEAGEKVEKEVDVVEGETFEENKN